MEIAFDWLAQRPAGCRGAATPWSRPYTAGIAEQQSTDATGGHRWDLTNATGPRLRGPAPGTVIVGLQGDGVPLGFTGQELPQTDPADTPYLEITYRPLDP